MLKGSELETARVARAVPVRHALPRAAEELRRLRRREGVRRRRDRRRHRHAAASTTTCSAATTHLACSIFWNNSWFDDAVRLRASRSASRASEWWSRDAATALEQDDGAGRRSCCATSSPRPRTSCSRRREACVDFYSEPRELRASQARRDRRQPDVQVPRARRLLPLAGGLPHRDRRRPAPLLRAHGRRARGLPTSSDCGTTSTATSRHKHTHGNTRDELLAPHPVTLHYDIEAWIDAGMPRDAAPSASPSRSRSSSSWRPTQRASSTA